MIDSDAKLKVVRDQLARAESALASLQSDVLPKNESLYFVMAESCFDTIAELRGLIEAYLGNNFTPEVTDNLLQQGMEFENG